MGTELDRINEELGLEEPSIARLADSVCPCPSLSGQAESVQAERDPVNNAGHRLDTDEDEPSEGWEKEADREGCVSLEPALLSLLKALPGHS